MREKAKNGYLSVNAIAGTYVVLLGIDVAAGSQTGLLGFALRRTDHTENEDYWLRGFKTFEATDPDPAPGTLVSTLEHPIQGFLWGDYTVKPNHSYTYTVVAMKGSPKTLVQDETVAVEISTENEDAGTHAVWFNRGVAGSQAYARKFKNAAPDEVPNNEAFIWLSRGLEEAILTFIDQAKGNNCALRASVYEF